MELNREDVVRRWKAARQQKKEITAREIQRLTQKYFGEINLAC